MPWVPITVISPWNDEIFAKFQRCDGQRYVEIMYLSIWFKIKDKHFVSLCITNLSFFQVFSHPVLNLFYFTCNHITTVVKIRTTWCKWLTSNKIFQPLKISATSGIPRYQKKLQSKPIDFSHTADWNCLFTLKYSSTNQTFYR